MLELAIGYGLILIVIWTPRPYQAFFYKIAAVFLLVVLWRSFRGWAAMGLRVKNLLRSLWVVGVALLLAGMTVLVAWHLQTLRDTGGPAQFVKRYWGYTLWSGVQQILLMDFFFLRFRRLLPSAGYAALMAAGLFALAHLPNPILTIATLVWGLAACAIFLRYRNLYPLALAHAIMGITLAITIPGPLIRNMRVGLGYLAYPHRSFHLHYRKHADQTVSTQAWVIADAPTRRC